MDSFPMLERCWRSQWRGYTLEEQAWMTQESERGHPVFIALGHSQYSLWRRERYHLSSSYPLPTLPGDDLISIKVDHWPDQFESLQKGSRPD